MVSWNMYKKRRARLILEQRNACFYCGHQMSPSNAHLPNSATLDHIQPRSITGRSSHSIGGGTVAACFTCNFRRGNRPFTAYLFALNAADMRIVSIAAIAYYGGNV